MPNALIIGCRGMLANAVADVLARRGVHAVGVDLPDCDITCPDQVKTAFDRSQPTVVFNCAAYTRVDACEDEEPKAAAINGHAVGHLARAAAAAGAKFIHISTDFVFDGQSQTPYKPADTPRPLSAYGRTKLLGETLLQEVNPRRWAILRTAWLYGPRGASFPRTMVERGRARQPLRVVSDQWGCPTYTQDLAEAMVDIGLGDAAGIFHATNSQPTNWYDFAVETLRQFGIDGDLAPTTTAEYLKARPKQAIRPMYSVLDCSTLHQAIGRPMRPWPLALADFVQAVTTAGGF